MRQLKHPFGFLNGRRVVPAEVEGGQTAECPADGCEERLHVRGPSTNGAVRHFWHPGSGGAGGDGGAHGGGVGESATHKNYKSHAASALLNFFGGFIEESTTKEIFEQRVPIPDTERYRQADTLVTFDTPHSTFGKGIIVEVQHENRDKDIDAVTRDYLDAEYSVWWTDSETHYEPGGYLFDRDKLEDETVTVWPNAVPEPNEWTGQRYRIKNLREVPFFTMDEYQAATSLYETWDNKFKRPYYSTNVQLPREFYEDRAREAFRETPWHELFSGYEWDHRTTLPAPDNGAKRNEHVDAKVHAIWDLPSLKELFRDTAWSELFPGYEHSHREIGDMVADSREESMPFSVRLPPEYYDGLEAECREIHRIVTAQESESVELLYRLTKNNASRRCGECGDGAAYYVFTDSVVSRFVCEDHLQNALIAATRSMPDQQQRAGGKA